MNKTAFLFGAQGTQWPGMGSDLVRDEPEFAASIAECENEIRKRGGWSLSNELRAPLSEYRAHCHPLMVQPTLTSVQIALVRLLRAEGIDANAAASLSMGEAAAAWCCGAITLPEAIEVAWRTALLTDEQLPPGLMAYLRTDWEQAGAIVEPWSGKVARAVELGRAVTVIAGDVVSVEHVLRTASGKGIRGGRLPLAQAYHSPFVHGIGERFREGLCGVRPQPTQIPLYSAAKGGIQSGEAMSVEHWWNICSRPSYFYTIARQMIRDGYRRFFEISPDPMLAESVRDAAREVGVKVEVLALMRRNCGRLGLRSALRRVEGHAQIE